MKTSPERRILDAHKRELINAMTEDELHAAVYLDPLTGLDNQRSYRATLARFKKNRVEPWFILFDLDNFHDINKRWGMAFADEVLKGLGHCIATSASDAYRYGDNADEVVILENDPNHVRKMKSTIRADLEMHRVVHVNDSGDLMLMTGISASHGVGSTFENAERDLTRNKAARLEAGMRYPRGKLPADRVVVIPADCRVIPSIRSAAL